MGLLFDKPRVRVLLFVVALVLGILMILYIVFQYHSTIYVPSAEKQTHDLVNQERLKNGTSSLAYDDSIAMVAREHSEAMAKGKVRIEHTTGFLNEPVYDHSGFVERMNKACGTAQRGGENLVRLDGNSWWDIASDAVDTWMNSPTHKHNMLEQGWTKEGIGIAINFWMGRIYMTEILCR